MQMPGNGNETNAEKKRRYRRLEDMIEFVIELTKKYDDMKELRSQLHTILWALKDEKIGYLKKEYGIEI